MKKGVVIALVAVVVIVAAVILLSVGDTNEDSKDLNSDDFSSDQQNQIQNNSQSRDDPPNQDQGTQPANKVSQTELSSHNTQDDCWISYKKDVFDITAFLPKHPGSAGAIIPYCGTSSEFENAFEDKHGASQVQKLMQEGIFKGELT